MSTDTKTTTTEAAKQAGNFLYVILSTRPDLLRIALDAVAGHLDSAGFEDAPMQAVMSGARWIIASDEAKNETTRWLADYSRELFANQEPTDE